MALRDSVRINFDTKGLMAQVKNLKQAIEEAVIPATQAAAQVFYDEVKLRATNLSDTGNLAASIYQYRVKEEQRPGHATYKVSWRKGRGKTKLGVADSAEDKAVKSLPIAYHGILVEYGYIQRYASYVGSDGNWYTAIRAEKRGTPKPKSRASQAVKDAYYVLRKGGPVQHAPRSFLRSGYEAAKGLAMQAFIAEMNQRVEQVV